MKFPRPAHMRRKTALVIAGAIFLLLWLFYGSVLLAGNQQLYHLDLPHLVYAFFVGPILPEMFLFTMGKVVSVTSISLGLLLLSFGCVIRWPNWVTTAFLCLSLMGHWLVALIGYSVMI